MTEAARGCDISWGMIFRSNLETDDGVPFLAVAALDLILRTSTIALAMPLPLPLPLPAPKSFLAVTALLAAMKQYVRCRLPVSTHSTGGDLDEADIIGDAALFA